MLKKFIRVTMLSLLTIASLSLLGCGGGGGGNKDKDKSDSGVVISPGEVTLIIGSSQQFTATVPGINNSNVTWSCLEPSGGGTITDNGLYTAPVTTGNYYIKAVSIADPSKSGTAIIHVINSSNIDPNTAKKYSGTITIENTGNAGELSVDQQATINVILFDEGTEVRFSNFVKSIPANVDASINDLQTDGETVTITGSLNSVSMTPPELVVYLVLNSPTNKYELFIGGVPINCTFTSPDISFQAINYVLGRHITNISLPNNKSRLTGDISVPVDDPELSGITQNISWDLQANF